MNDAELRIRLPQSLRDRLEEEAIAQGLNFAEFVRMKLSLGTHPILSRVTGLESLDAALKPKSLLDRAMELKDKK